MTDAESFGIRIAGHAADFGWPPLADYAERLASELEAFDMENLTRTLKRFPDVLTELEEADPRHGE